MKIIGDRNVVSFDIFHSMMETSTPGASFAFLQQLTRISTSRGEGRKQTHTHTHTFPGKSKQEIGFRDLGKEGGIYRTQRGNYEERERETEWSHSMVSSSPFWKWVGGWRVGGFLVWCVCEAGRLAGRDPDSLLFPCPPPSSGISERRDIGPFFYGKLKTSSHAKSPVCPTQEGKPPLGKRYFIWEKIAIKEGGEGLEKERD